MTNLIDQLVKNISIEGFKKRGTNWRFARQDLVFIINLQKSRFNDLEQSFTLNFSILSSSAYKLCWGEPLPLFPKESDGLFRKRIGFFCKSLAGNDWYTLRNEKDVSESILHIERCITSKAIPFFNTINSSADFCNFLMSKDFPKQDYLYLINLACLAHIVDDDKECLHLLDKVIEESATWRKNASEVKMRIFS